MGLRTLCVHGIVTFEWDARARVWTPAPGQGGKSCGCLGTCAKHRRPVMLEPEEDACPLCNAPLVRQERTTMEPVDPPQDAPESGA